jgi:hypothetical protein
LGYDRVAMLAAIEKGRFVFQVRPGRTALVGGAVALVLAPLFFFSNLGAESTLAGIVLFPMALWGICKGALQWNRVWTCYSQGLECEGRFVPFRDIEAMRAKIASVHGARSYEFFFRGSNEGGPFAIRWRWGEAFRDCDKAQYLVKRAAGAIAERMETELEKRGSVRWGKYARIRADSLCVESTGVELAYTDVAEAKISRDCLPFTKLVLVDLGEKV